MSLNVHVGYFETTIGAAYQDITDVGFRGKVLEVWGVGSTFAQDGTIQPDQHFFYGAATSTAKNNQRYGLIRTPDAGVISQCNKQFGDGVLGIFDSPTTLACAGQLSLWLQNGFRIAYPVVPTQSFLVFYAVYGGTDADELRLLQENIDEADLLPHTRDYVGFGFIPQFAKTFGVRGQNTATLPGTLNIDTHPTFHLGVAKSTAQRWSIALTGSNAIAIAGQLKARNLQVSDKMLSMLTVSTVTPAVEKDIAFNSFLADTVRVDQQEYSATVSRRFAMMAVSGPQFAAGVVNRSAGAVIGLPFKPMLYGIASTHKATSIAVGGDSQICFGIGSRENQHCSWTRLKDITIPTAAKHCTKTGAIFISADATPAIDTIATGTVTEDGFSWVSSPSGAIDDEFVWWAMGEAIPGTIIPNTDPIFRDITQAFEVPEIPKPAYLAPLVEPVFSDPDLKFPTVTRIADDPGNSAIISELPNLNVTTVTWGKRARHVYSKQQAWNWDESLYITENTRTDTHLNNGGTPSKLLLDGQTMIPKHKFGPIVTANIYEYRWYPSGANKNILINTTSDELKLQWLDVMNDLVVKEWDLSTAIPLGIDTDEEWNLSDDGRYIALFRPVDTSGVTSNDVDVFVVDMSVPPPGGIGPVLRVFSSDPAPPGAFSNRIATWVSISPSGTYAVIHWRGEKTSVLDFNPGTLALSVRNMGAFGSGVGGDQWVSKNFACTTNGTTTVSSVGLFSNDTGMKGMKVTGGLVAGVPTTVYVVSVTSANALVVTQALDAGAPVLRIGDEADKGYIWRMGHADMTLNPLDSNVDVIIGQDERFVVGDIFNGRPISHVVMVRLSDGSVTSITPVSVGGIVEATSGHISCRNKKRPGWCYVSYFEKTSPSSALFNQEIIAAKLLADGATTGYEVERYAHHHSDSSTLGGNPTNTYPAEPHVLPNWDGKRIIFSSDWHRQYNGLAGDAHYESVSGDIYPAGVGPWYPAGNYQDYLILTETTDTIYPVVGGAVSPNDIIALAKSRVGSTTTLVDWNNLFKIVIDEIFTRRKWRFARQEIVYTHPANNLIYTFSGYNLNLNDIISIRQKTTPVELVFWPSQEFYENYPDPKEKGVPEIYTRIRKNDGVTGMRIAVYPIPAVNVDLYVLGDFIPTYTIDSNPMPILPVQFHRIVIDGLVGHAAEELGKDRLSDRAFARFEKGIAELIDWDNKDSKHKMERQSISMSRPRGPVFPSNFPRRS